MIVVQTEREHQGRTIAHCAPECKSNSVRARCVMSEWEKKTRIAVRIIRSRAVKVVKKDQRDEEIMCFS